MGSRRLEAPKSPSFLLIQNAHGSASIAFFSFTASTAAGKCLGPPRPVTLSLCRMQSTYKPLASLRGPQAECKRPVLEGSSDVTRGVHHIRCLRQQGMQTQQPQTCLAPWAWACHNVVMSLTTLRQACCSRGAYLLGPCCATAQCSTTGRDPVGFGPAPTQQFARRRCLLQTLVIGSGNKNTAGA